MRNLVVTLIFGLSILFIYGCDEMSPVTSDQELLNRNADASSASVHQAARHATGGFEVWAVDQSNSAGLDHGGAIHIFEGAGLMGESASEKEPLEVVDLAEATTELCQSSTGADPIRPHMLLFNSANTHAILSFVVSGHVVIYDAESREPLDCIRMSEGAGGAIQAHAAFPSPDDSYILVANQNGKLMERIDTDYAANSFFHNTDATLDLAVGQTPNGEDREDPELRPDNAPICPIIDSSSKYGFVTLRGGGLFVVDATETPMEIVAEYDKDHVVGNGCGGIEAGGSMFINSGGGTQANLFTFDLYRFPLEGYDPGNPPNTPEREVVASLDGERDSHGIAVTRHERNLWVLDRMANSVEVFEVASGDHVNTIDLTGPLTMNPSPDLAAVSPSGNRVFVSLRGLNPLSGDPHVAEGDSPGIGVLQVTGNGQSGALKTVVPISNMVEENGEMIERADIHGIAVRLVRHVSP